MDLLRDEVHIWQVPLDPPARLLKVARDVLDNAEHGRAAGFAVASERTRFIAAHLALRMVLARYTGASPGGLVLVHGAHGKPALAAGFAWLRFNLAHSGDLALIACAQGREVGVDIEQIRPDSADEAIAAQLFSAGEQAALRTLSAHLRPAGFFACWTRKEAYVKARGLGLTIPLADFDVPLDPMLPATRIILRNEPDADGDWWVQDLPLGMLYAAAVAAEGTGWRITRLPWSWSAT